MEERNSNGKKGWVNNSLNMSNGMGLDQILKRAIEKVREKKAEELYGKKEGSEKSQDDSLEKLNDLRKSKKTDEKQLTSATTSGESTPNLQK